MIQSYVEELRNHLKKVTIPADGDNYLDLGNTDLCLSDEKLFQVDTLPYKPLAEATTLIINALNNKYIDMVKIGINEFLKTYLRVTSKHNGEKATHIFMLRMKMIFEYSVLDSFPYTDLLWQYICHCIHNVAFYLLIKDNIEAAKILLDYTAAMGKTAAKKGLRTDILQHFLLMFEIEAQERGYEKLGGEAKNHRHNLEN